MAKKRKTKDGFMSLVLVCFVLFCAVKIVDIQQNITEKEKKYASNFSMPLSPMAFTDFSAIGLKIPTR